MGDSAVRQHGQLDQPSGPNQAERTHGSPTHTHPGTASPHPEPPSERPADGDNTSEDEDENGGSGAAASRVKALNFDDLSRHFHLPINAAAKELGICVTVLKKKCRKYGVARWPHRKIKSLDRLVEKLEREEATAIDKEYYRNELDGLRQRKDHMLRTDTGTGNLPVPQTQPTTPIFGAQPEQRSSLGLHDSTDLALASAGNPNHANYQFQQGYMPYPGVENGGVPMYQQQLYFVPQGSQSVVRQGQYYPPIPQAAYPGPKMAGMQATANFHSAQIVPVPMPMAMPMHYPLYQANASQNGGSQSFPHSLSAHQHQQHPQAPPGQVENPAIGVPVDARAWAATQALAPEVNGTEGPPVANPVELGARHAEVLGGGVPNIAGQQNNLRSGNRADTTMNEPESQNEGSRGSRPSHAPTPSEKKRDLLGDPSAGEAKDGHTNQRWTRERSSGTTTEPTERTKSKGEASAPDRTKLVLSGKQAAQDKLHSLASASWEQQDVNSSAGKREVSPTDPPSPPGGSGSGSGSGSGEEVGGGPAQKDGPDPSIFRSLNLTVWSTDMSLRVLNCSGDPGCTGFHGSKFTVGTTIPDVVAGHEHSQILCDPYLMARKGQEGERIYKAADGKRYIQFFKPLRSKDEIIGTAGVCLDITNSSLYL